jgi:hypothetical protein
VENHDAVAIIHWVDSDFWVTVTRARTNDGFAVVTNHQVRGRKPMKTLSSIAIETAAPSGVPSVVEAPSVVAVLAPASGANDSCGNATKVSALPYGAASSLNATNRPDYVTGGKNSCNKYQSGGGIVNWWSLVGE